MHRFGHHGFHDTLSKGTAVQQRTKRKKIHRHSKCAISEQANLQPDKILFDEAKRYLKEHNFDASLAAMKTLTGTYPNSPYTVTAKRMVAEALKVATENRKVREHRDPP